MAYWWGPSPCTIDLLIASETQIRNAVRCRWPSMTIAGTYQLLKLGL